jgi:coproporphyrinogen III oxidase
MNTLIEPSVHIYNREEVSQAFREVQTSICNGLSAADGQKSFSEDPWQHHEGGGGLSRVISHGGVFEKGGVNFSAVEGVLPEFMKYRIKSGATHFFATGVSLVIHPSSPMVPIVHANIRYFETNAGDAWFGGGIDLTPIYVDVAQGAQFHHTLKATCDRFDPGYYSRFKQEADDYFFITHRNETRGIGGVFFDHLRDQANERSVFDFVTAIGHTFLSAYVPIVEANKNLEYTEAHKQWQMIRRGRYVEFNLVYDRGTRFGLETGGRTESILMSLPEHASWFYNHQPDEHSAEAASCKYYKKGIDWVNLT